MMRMAAAARAKGLRSSSTRTTRAEVGGEPLLEARAFRVRARFEGGGRRIGLGVTHDVTVSRVASGWALGKRFATKKRKCFPRIEARPP
jgi:hypothetical protein